MAIIVSGMVYRHQTATTEKECDACFQPIYVGKTYLRVKWKEKSMIEMFHPACFREEFTDDGPQ